jgi:hypothetical protein
MRTWMIAVVSLAFAAGCAMEAGSADDHVGPDGQPLGAANDSVSTTEGTAATGSTAASISECNSPDPQPWNCPIVRPSSNGGGTKTQPHDVFGNSGSDTPNTPTTPATP